MIEKKLRVLIYSWLAIIHFFFLFSFLFQEKKFYKKPQSASDVPLFVQFILRKIWRMYHITCVTPDKEKVKREREKMVEGEKQNSLLIQKFSSPFFLPQKTGRSRCQGLRYHDPPQGSPPFARRAKISPPCFVRKVASYCSCCFVDGCPLPPFSY